MAEVNEPVTWTDEVLALLEKVAAHFEDTDAPLGEEARRLLQVAQSDSVVDSEASGAEVIPIGPLCDEDTA